MEEGCTFVLGGNAEGVGWKELDEGRIFSLKNMEYFLLTYI